MTIVDIFRPIVAEETVTSAVSDQLKLWLPTYLKEIRLQRSEPIDLPDPRSYNVRPENDRWDEDQMPAVIVVCPGLAAAPSMDGEGNYNAPFRVGVVVFALGNDDLSVRLNLGLYAAAVRAILVQKPSLGGLADGSEWTMESYDSAPVESSRTMGAATVEFIFNIPGVVNVYGGPSETIPSEPGPLDEDPIPGSDWHTVQETYLEVEKDEIGG